MTEHQIEEWTDDDGVAKYSYRGWELRQVECVEYPQYSPIWQAHSPHEATFAEHEMLVLGMGFSETKAHLALSCNQGTCIFTRPVRHEVLYGYWTIESCIDRFEEHIEKLRREAFEQAGIRMDGDGAARLREIVRE